MAKMCVCKIRESKASSALRVMHRRSTLMSSGLGVASSVMERGRMSTEGGPSPPPLFVFHPVYVFGNVSVNIGGGDSASREV